MFGASIDLQLLEHLTAQGTLGQHAFYSMGDDEFGLSGLHLFEGQFAQTAGETGVMLVDLCGALLAGDFYLFCVDDDYIIRIAKEKLNLRLPEEIIFYNDLAN